MRAASLKEARALKGPLVYALLDDDGVFYIGRTTKPATRFYTHRTADHPNSIYLARRLRKSGSSVRVRVLSKNPSDLKAVELDAIRRYSTTALNFTGNPSRLPSFNRGVIGADCPQCGHKIDVKRSKFCASCFEKIHGASSKEDLRDMAAKAVAAFRKTA